MRQNEGAWLGDVLANAEFLPVRVSRSKTLTDEPDLV